MPGPAGVPPCHETITTSSAGSEPRATSSKSRSKGTGRGDQPRAQTSKAPAESRGPCQHNYSKPRSCKGPAARPQRGGPVSVREAKRRAYLVANRLPVGCACGRDCLAQPSQLCPLQSWAPEPVGRLWEGRCSGCRSAGRHGSARLMAILGRGRRRLRRGRRRLLPRALVLPLDDPAAERRPGRRAR